MSLKDNDFLVYCVFGFMATAVNMLSYELLFRLAGMPNVPAVALSWVLAVTFAFFTNKFIVFRHEEGKKKSLVSQLGFFYLCRAASGLVDVVIMFVSVDIFALNHTVWKFISNLAVGVCNYLAGKFFIFRGKKTIRECK